MSNDESHLQLEPQNMDHLWFILGLLCMLLALGLAWLHLSDWIAIKESLIGEDYRLGCGMIVLAGILFSIWPRGRWVKRCIFVVTLDCLSIVFLFTVISTQSKQVDVFAIDPLLIVGLWIWALFGTGHFAMLGAILYLRKTRSHRRPSRLICRKCGYDLRGLPSNRCPECGWPDQGN